MVQASDVAALGEPDFSADDVREALTGPHTDPAQDCWVAVDPTGEIVGWAYPENPSGGVRDFIEVYVHPERGSPALTPLLSLILGRVAVRAAGFGNDRAVVRAGAIPSERHWIDALTAAGFGFVKRYARMRRDLVDVAPTPPSPPPPLTVRPVRADDDTEMRRFHALIEEAFVDAGEHPPIDYEAWRVQLDKLPSIAFDEWFVAEVDGDWAGVLQSADQALDRNEGWVKMLAVRRPYRRRGVGESLLRRAFATYAAKGRAAAGLGVDLANPTAPARLYRAVGMTPAYECDMFERTIPAAR
jgi:ribosomal protein S18 acetylase RimI-like enzyme